MNLIDFPAPQPEPIASAIAKDLLAGLNAELARRVEHHAAEFRKFWQSDATPDDILTELGAYAPLLLASSRESLRNIATLAAQVGKTLDDAIPPSDYYPPREFVENEDGTITLAPPADGYDAWGNLIPVPESQSDPITEP